MNLETLKKQIRSGAIDTVLVALPDPFGRPVGKRFRGDVFLNSVASHGTHGCSYLLTVNLDNPTGYGRIVRDKQGDVQSIVEQKDSAPEQLQIKEVNTGIMLVPTAKLREWLGKLKNTKAQGEYYLTDIVAMAVQNSSFV